jgi:hypothetical protein
MQEQMVHVLLPVVTALLEAAIETIEGTTGGPAVVFIQYDGNYTLSSNLPGITNSVQFLGGSTTNVILDGQGSYQFFNLTGGTVYITNMTMYNGSATLVVLSATLVQH